MNTTLSLFPLLALLALVIIVSPAAWRFVSGRKSKARFFDRLESAFARYDRP